MLGKNKNGIKLCGHFTGNDSFMFVMSHTITSALADWKRFM